MRNIRELYIKNKAQILLLLILTLAAILRFYGINGQSLWLDELYTMKECDPAVTWGECMRLVLANESKSPLYFFVIKAAFSVFGYTSFVARAFSAIGGILSVYAMYLLAKELFNQRVAWFAALITCINPFLIFYSQEARSYIFIFLFTALSFLDFARALRLRTKKPAIASALYNLVVLYLHPFALLTIFAQFIVGVYLAFRDKGSRKEYLTMLASGGLILLVGFAPMFPPLLRTTSETSIWIPVPPADFFIQYFYEFFGSSELLKPFLYIALIAYVVNVITLQHPEERIKKTELNFAIFLVTLATVFLTAYLISVLRLPVLVIRYTIITLPVFILVIAAGAGNITSQITGNLLLLLFVIISLLEFIVIKDYYHTPNKSQIREMTEYIKRSSDKYPVINERTGWQQSYYLEKYGIKSELIRMNKENYTRHVLKDSLSPEGFWLAGAHLEPKLETTLAAMLEKKYILFRSKDFYDAWAQLYLKAPDTANTINLTTRAFYKENVARIEGDTVVTLWEGEPRKSTPVLLSKGKYKVSVLARGTPFEGVFPHLNIFIDSMKAGEFYVKEDFDFSPEFETKIERPGRVILSLQMDNDDNGFTTGRTKEDRNAFVRMVILKKQE